MSLLLLLRKPPTVVAPAVVPVYQNPSLINGQFDNLNGWWAANATIELSNGRLRVTQAAAGFVAYAGIDIPNLTIGQTYVARVSRKDASLAEVNSYISVRGMDTASWSVSSDLGVSFVATATTHTVEVGLIGSQPVGTWVEFDDVALYPYNPPADTYALNADFNDIGGWSPATTQQLIAGGKVRLTRFFANNAYENTKQALRNLPVGTPVPVKVNVTGYTSVTNQAIYAGIVGFGNYTQTAAGELSFTFTPTSTEHTLEVGFFPVGGTKGDSFEVDSVLVGTPMVVEPIQKIYKGVKTLEQLLLGTKTEAQLYLGSQDLI